MSHWCPYNGDLRRHTSDTCRPDTYRCNLCGRMWTTEPRTWHDSGYPDADGEVLVPVSPNDENSNPKEPSGRGGP